MGSILGRPSSSVLALLTAVFNVIVVFHVGGFAPNADQIATVDTALTALIAVVSNANVSTALKTAPPPTNP